MSQILQPYRVSIVHADLSSPEVLKDLFHALDHLSTTIDDVFNRIEKRIGEERKRVDQIKSRVHSCKVAVDKVSGSVKATTVFSTAKFPAPKMLPSYPTLFSQINVMPSCYRDVEDEEQYNLPLSKDSVVGNRDLEIEVTGILYRLNTNSTDIERVEFIMEEDGLGTLPPTIASVGSLLLFNSRINPYKDYQTLDNLISSGREKAVELDELKALANAPKTLVDGDALPDIQALDLLFKPQMGEMTSLALPENLPLDFIASGITFNAGDLPSIAPSAAFGNKPNYALPQLTYDGGPSRRQSSTAYSAGPLLSPAAPLPSAVAAAPPPPPPPPPMGMQPPLQPQAMQQQPHAAPPAAATSFSAPPPPPPPPTLSAPPPAMAMPAVPVEAPPLEEEDVGPTGNPLLDAIRGFKDVTKLRSKEEGAMAAAKVQKKVEISGTGNAFNDLKERLARRNNALTGKDDKAQKKRDSVVVQDARIRQALAAAIKPPAPSHTNNATASKPAPPKPAPPPPTKSSIMNMGFASIDEEATANSDDDSFVGFRPRAGANNDDEDSDSIVSDFSDESTRFSVKPSPQRAQSFLSSPTKAPVTNAAPPPETGSGGGLLNASNVQVNQMLRKASLVTDVKEDKEEDDDWD